MDGKASRQSVVRQVRSEIPGVRLGVGAPQAGLLFYVAGWIDEGVGALRLATKGVNLEEVDLAQGLAYAGLLQPLLPAGKDERDLALRIHRHELVKAEDTLRRIAARETGEVDLEVAIRHCFGNQR